MRLTPSLLVSAAALIFCPTVLPAQSTVPAPSIGLPLPPIGLPLPELTLPPLAETSAARPLIPGDGPPLHPQRPAMVWFGLAPYAWGFESWQQSPAPGMIPTEPPVEPSTTIPAHNTGRLRLEIEPVDAQVFVDGEFVGTVKDHQGELEIEAGTRRIEIRAPKHEALTFDVRVVAGRTLTYRGALTRIGVGPREPVVEDRVPAPPKTATPATKQVERSSTQTFYLIPGCYLGNVPPHLVKLPADCDLSRLITHSPRQ